MEIVSLMDIVFEVIIVLHKFIIQTHLTQTDTAIFSGRIAMIDVTGNIFSLGLFYFSHATP